MEQPGLTRQLEPEPELRKLFHDLLGPISAIKMRAQLLKRKADPEDVQKAVEVICNSVERCQDLITDYRERLLRE